MDQKEKDFIIKKLREKSSVGKLLSYNMIVADAKKNGFKNINEGRLSRFIKENEASIIKLGIVLGKERVKDQTIDRSRAKPRGPHLEEAKRKHFIFTKSLE